MNSRIYYCGVEKNHHNRAGAVVVPEHQIFDLFLDLLENVDAVVVVADAAVATI